MRYYYLYLFIYSIRFIYSKRSLGYFTLKIDRSICSDLRNFSKTFNASSINLTLFNPARNTNSL